jgi:membrane fusion protein (multidrug efflux system)
VTRRSVEIRARVAQGQQLLMVVQTDDLWVTVNFKETQLNRMRKGQHVQIHVDALGDDLMVISKTCLQQRGPHERIASGECNGQLRQGHSATAVRIRFKPNQRDLDKTTARHVGRTERTSRLSCGLRPQFMPIFALSD